MEPIDITAVDSGNFEYFKPFIPAYLYPQIASGEAVLAIGAIVNSAACAALIFEIDEGVARILSIYISPPYRRQYIGTTLFCELVEYLEATDYLMTQSVAVNYEDDGSGIKEFFDSLQFVQQPQEEKTLEIKLDRLFESRLLKLPHSKPDEMVIAPLSEISAYHLRQLNNVLDSRGANYLGVPVSKQSVIVDLSLVGYKDDAPVCCACFSQGATDKELILSVFYTDILNTAIPVSVLQEAASLLRKRFADDAVIRLPLVEQSAVKLAEALIGDVGTVCSTMLSAVFEMGAFED